jgi:hypothetical protein
MADGNRLEKLTSGAKAHVHSTDFMPGINPRHTTRTSLFAACMVLFAGLLAVSGCRSYHVEIMVENRTGTSIQLLEVDYPSASFGADRLAADAELYYRIQTRGEGTVKVQYTATGGHQEKLSGPMLYERQEGSLLIVLLPGGKAEFRPRLTPGH